MGISKEKRLKWSELTQQERDRVVRMAWEDRTSFESIREQFGLGPNEVERFMRTQLDKKSYTRWRKRAQMRGHLKQAKLRPQGFSRFKCSRQSADGVTKGWK